MPTLADKEEPKEVSKKREEQNEDKKEDHKGEDKNSKGSDSEDEQQELTISRKTDVPKRSEIASNEEEVKEKEGHSYKRAEERRARYYKI